MPAVNFWLVGLRSLPGSNGTLAAHTTSGHGMLQATLSIMPNCIMTCTALLAFPI